MAKNGKGFEKFLREQAETKQPVAKSQFFRAANKSPEEEAAYQAAKRAFELQLARQEATTEVEEKTYTPKGETTPRKYGVRVPKTDVDLTNVPSEQEVEQAFETSRKASLAVDDTKKISPAYWVTQKDFQDAFGRRYDAMSEQDRQDFFGLVGSSQPRRYTEGPAAGQIIPSTRRPDFIPTYQDVDGVRVPETAFGGAPSKEKSQGFGFQAPTTPSQVSGSGVLTGPKVKPDLSDEEYERRRQERISQKAREMLSREPAPAPELPPAPEPKSLSDLELERMKRDAEEAPAPAPDPVVATLVSEPISLEDLYKAWDPDGTWQAKIEAEENAPELATGDLQKLLGYYGKSAVPPTKTRGISSPKPAPANLSGVGLYGGVLGQMRFARGQKPSQPEVGAMGPTRSEAELSKMMRDARESEPAPAPELPPPPAPDLESLSDLELARMKRDAKESEPSGLSQAMGLAQGVGQFSKNLDQAAGRKVREAGQKISDIAKRFRTQRDENAKKNIERLEAQGIRVPGFDTGEKGFGQRNVQYAEAGLDTEGPPSPAQYGGGFEPESAPAPDPEPAPAVEPESTDLGYLGSVQIYDKESERAKAIRRMIGMDPLGQLKYEKQQTFSPSGKEQVAPGALPPRRRGREFEEGIPVPKEIEDAIRARRMPATAPAAAAETISRQQSPKFDVLSPISQEMASRLLSVQTPGQVSTPLTGRPLTTQAGDKFKFDSGIPASVAAAMDRVSPVRTPLSQEPLTTQDKNAPKSERKRDIISFTKGMSDAEVNVEFEKIFGKENKDLSIEMKKDMIERFKLSEMIQNGAIMGGDLMYEIEIDPDTGELKLNPKKKVN